MEMVPVDAQRAYADIRDRITSLDLAPGAQVNEQQLAEEMDLGLPPVREALKLLAHENLIVITPRHGLYVADVNIPDLQQLSEIRLTLEALSARLAADRATPDDIAVLEALRQEQAARVGAGSRDLLDLDHRFHKAISGAARNKYLAAALERLFGLSQRLWCLALPRLEGLPSAVEKHHDLVEAIRDSDGDRAEETMRQHVAQFYAHVQAILADRALDHAQAQQR